MRFGETAAPDERCVTMTPGLINAARFIAVLATGSDVAAVVQRIETGREPLPPEHGETVTRP